MRKPLNKAALITPVHGIIVNGNGTSPSDQAGVSSDGS
jgi:hypothetical protein